MTQRKSFSLIRITPEAGTVKTNEAREVVLHPQIVELGFLEFVASAAPGHLFLTLRRDGDVLKPLQTLKNRLAEFGRALLPDEGVAPNHGWRHRFKTVGMEAGIPLRILDAIQGHAPSTLADSYGDVTLRTMADSIAKVPRFLCEQRPPNETGFGLSHALILTAPSQLTTGFKLLTSKRLAEACLTSTTNSLGIKCTEAIWDEQPIRFETSSRMERPRPAAATISVHLHRYQPQKPRAMQ